VARGKLTAATFTSLTRIFLQIAAFLPTLREIHSVQRFAKQDYPEPLNNRIPEVTMKSLISAAIVATALIVPAASFAQQANAPVTRAQVRAELIAAEQNGTLFQNDTNYPKQAAQPVTVAAAASEQTQAVGGIAGSTSQSGARPSIGDGLFSTYRGQ